jgi:hypothetical protein
LLHDIDGELASGLGIDTVHGGLQKLIGLAAGAADLSVLFGRRLDVLAEIGIRE